MRLLKEDRCMRAVMKIEQLEVCDTEEKHSQSDRLRALCCIAFHRSRVNEILENL